MTTDRKEVRKMAQMYASGHTLREVGEAFDLSGEGVRQLFQKYDVPRRPRGGGKPSSLTEAKKQQVARGYLNGATRRELAGEFGVTRAEVDRVLKDKLTEQQVQRRMRDVATSKAVVRDWADWQMVEALQRCADDLGSRFSQAAYANWRDAQDVEYPSVNLFQTRASTFTDDDVPKWNKWREKAGLPVYEADNRYVKYSDDTMYHALSAVEATVGQFPSITEYDHHRPAGSPTAGAVRRRHGGRWGAVRKAYEARK